jgi:predicted N-acetyltransferase YhbS
LRSEKSGPDDIAAVREVNRRAFEREQESNIIDALRMNRAALFSLVATASERVTGHIISSPVTIAGNVKGAALGPMAVLPEHQRQGIGIRLIEAGNPKSKMEAIHSSLSRPRGVLSSIRIQISEGVWNQVRMGCFR